jgi:hypothetical protein
VEFKRGLGYFAKADYQTALNVVGGWEMKSPYANYTLKGFKSVSTKLTTIDKVERWND